jgi:hypothetical protein
MAYTRSTDKNGGEGEILLTPISPSVADYKKFRKLLCLQ